MDQPNLPFAQEAEQEQEKAPTRRKFGRRHLMIGCAALLIVASVVLNIVLFGGKTNPIDPSTDASTDQDGADTSVDNSVDGYFSATQVSRQRARDEALEVLQSVVDNESADEATKTEALLEISELAAAMEAEANIETLVLAKGFAQCVAVINGESCSVVVRGENLQANQISQINEIVYEQAGITPANIRIITK